MVKIQAMSITLLFNTGDYSESETYQPNHNANV